MTLTLHLCRWALTAGAVCLPREGGRRHSPGVIPASVGECPAEARGWENLPLGVDGLLGAQQHPRQGGEEPEAHLGVSGWLEAAPEGGHKLGQYSSQGWAWKTHIPSPRYSCSRRGTWPVVARLAGPSTGRRFRGGASACPITFPSFRTVGVTIRETI